jgi:hypothetical protein
MVFPEICIFLHFCGIVVVICRIISSRQDVSASITRWQHVQCAEATCRCNISDVHPPHCQHSGWF